MANVKKKTERVSTAAAIEELKAEIINEVLALANRQISSAAGLMEKGRELAVLMKDAGATVSAPAALKPAMPPPVEEVTDLRATLEGRSPPKKPAPPKRKMRAEDF